MDELQIRIAIALISCVLIGFPIIYHLTKKSNKPINVAEILKDCKAGTKLHHVLYGEVTLFFVEDGKIFYFITDSTGMVHEEWVNEYGNVDYMPTTECELFPSEDILTWKNYKQSK